MRSPLTREAVRWVASAWRRGGPGLAGVVVAVAAALALLIPLPPLVVDLLLALSLGAAAGVLLAAVAAPEPARLTAMPPLMVLISLARIVLCMCVSRLILTAGEAGTLVPALGRVMGGGDVLAGLGMLVVLAVVQVVMVTTGVGRMSEVAARFALDALPGKQMGLDTAVSGGHLSAAEARGEVRRLEQEANFYGAMDGAGRLLRGEAVAAIVIVALTAAAGVARAMGSGMEAGQAWSTYVLLATGQGLVTIIPALVSGAAAALLVSRSASASSLTRELGAQMLISPWPLVAAAAALLALGLLPGVAKAPTLLGGAVLAVVAWWLMRAGGPAPERSPSEAPGADEQGDEHAGLVLELGLGLLDLVEEPDSLMELLPDLRREVGRRLGFAIPPITVRDSLDLRATEYAIVFRAGTLSRGTVRPGRVLAVPPGAGATPDVGQPAELADGRTGVWVEPDEAGELAAGRYSLMSPREVLAENLSIILRRRAAQIFNLESAAAMLRRLRGDHAALIDEAEAAGLSVGLFRRVCARLLWAGVPLHDLISVVEGITEALPQEQDAERLALAVRPRLAGMLSDHLAEDGRVRALSLSPTLEEELAEAALREGDRTVAALPPARAAAWVDLLDQAGREHGWGRPLAVLTEPRSLLPLQWLCRQAQSELVALQATDLSPRVQVEHVARLEPEQLG